MIHLPVSSLLRSFITSSHGPFLMDLHSLMVVVVVSFSICHLIIIIKSILDLDVAQTIFQNHLVSSISYSFPSQKISCSTNIRWFKYCHWLVYCTIDMPHTYTTKNLGWISYAQSPIWSYFMSAHFQGEELNFRPPFQAGDTPTECTYGGSGVKQSFILSVFS